MSATWNLSAIEGQFGTTAARRVDWVGDTIKVMLATSGYTPNQDTHDFVNDVTNEVSGTGYTAGGATLGTKSVVATGATNVVALLAAPSVWSTATFTARYGIVYKDTGSAATSPIMGTVDFGGDQAVAAATFQITWDAVNGVLKGTV